MEVKTFTLELPASCATEVIIIESGPSVVIVGANGSGKTRLGTWIEFQSSQRSYVHRISAQKSLTMPEYSVTSSLERAESALRFGYEDIKTIQGNFDYYKTTQRWGQKPNTFLLNDFEKLMVYLFTEHFEETSAYFESSKRSEQRVTPPETKLDTVKAIWELILPHRELKITPGKIETRLRDDTNNLYSASEMSDGERVIFYLIGQALSAPQNGIIVIDEPELHLHKSIQTSLWRKIQAERSDCLFIYMTHDVEFAAALTEAKKIWLKSFDGKVWEWEEVPTLEGLPEELLIRIVGSRRPILFVEGENGSYDTSLFQSIYPNHTVIPRNSCSQVILATRALRQATQFHHLHARGIIDRDRLNSDEIASLRRDGIEVLNVAEIENLFCVPEILKLVAVQQGLSADETFESAKALVFRELQKNLDAQVSLHVANEIRFKLNAFDIKKQGMESLQEELKLRTKSINIEVIYAEFQTRFNDVIEKRDYIGALRLFNRKGLASQLSGIFEIKSLPDHVLRMVQSEKPEDWIKAFNIYVPNFDL